MGSCMNLDVIKFNPLVLKTKKFNKLHIKLLPSCFPTDKVRCFAVYGLIVVTSFFPKFSAKNTPRLNIRPHTDAYTHKHTK